MIVSNGQGRREGVKGCFYNEIIRFGWGVPTPKLVHSPRYFGHRGIGLTAHDITNALT